LAIHVTKDQQICRKRGNNEMNWSIVSLTILQSVTYCPHTKGWVDCGGRSHAGMVYPTMWLSAVQNATRTTSLYTVHQSAKFTRSSAYAVEYCTIQVSALR